MPVACLDIPHKIGDQYKSDKMLCDRASTNIPQSVDEDSELEIVFEGDVDREDTSDQNLESEEDTDEEEEEEEDDDDYETSSVYDHNDSEGESDSDVDQPNCHEVPFWFSYEEEGKFYLCFTLFLINYLNLC